MNKKLSSILETIYSSELPQEEFSAIIRQMYRRLDDSFDCDPPSLEQKRILDQMLVLADKLEEFYK